MSAAAVEDAEVFYKLFKAGSKQAVKSGAQQLELPDHVARFLASQFAFTLDLLKKGRSLNGPYLAVLLAEKNLGIAAVAAGQRYDCAISVLLLSASLLKSVGMTTFTGPAHLAITGLELLSNVYTTDKACGVSDQVAKAVQSTTLPAAAWLERGLTQWLMRGTGY